MLRLKELRTERGLTGQEVSDAIDVERSLYTRYEQGSRVPPLDKLWKLADFFGVTLDYLVGRDVNAGLMAETECDAGRESNAELCTTSDPATTIPEKKPPFTPEQLEYMDSWRKDMMTEVLAAVQDETCSCKANDVA